MYFKIRENKLFSVAVLLVAMIFILIPYNVKAMTPTQRSRCEVFARCVGYLRPVNNFNPGKLQEYKDRKYFDSALNNNFNQNEKDNN